MGNENATRLTSRWKARWSAFEQKTLLLGALAAFTMIGGLWTADALLPERIAEGVRIAGVDVGGLSPEQARERIEADVARPLAKPVAVTFEGRKFVATPKRLQLRADPNAMVQDALDAGNSGGAPGRVWRRVTGAKVHKNIGPRVTYSAQALEAFAAGVEKQINRQPRDATVEPSPTSIQPTPSLPGIDVRSASFRNRLETALQNIKHRTVVPPADKAEPEITTDELAEEYPVYLTIDRASFSLRLYENLKLVKTYTVAVGAAGYETPTGLYQIQDRGENVPWNVPERPWAGDLAGTTVPGGAPNNPLKARWLGIYDGAGIHGTDDLGSLGTAASHGCIRMAIPDVIELYPSVPVGAPVYIG